MRLKFFEILGFAVLYLKQRYVCIKLIYLKRTKFPLLAQASACAVRQKEQTSFERYSSAKYMAATISNLYIPLNFLKTNLPEESQADACAKTIRYFKYFIYFIYLIYLICPNSRATHCL